MSKLENLVPELDLCKQIPRGAFAESALVWSRRPVYYKPHVWVIPRNHAAEVRDICPAPTLQEIMRALPESVEYQFFNGKFLPCHPKFDEENFADEKPENAALKLWMEMQCIDPVADSNGGNGENGEYGGRALHGAAREAGDAQ